MAKNESRHGLRIIRAADDILRKHVHSLGEVHVAVVEVALRHRHKMRNDCHADATFLFRRTPRAGTEAIDRLTSNDTQWLRRGQFSSFLSGEDIALA